MVDQTVSRSAVTADESRRHCSDSRSSCRRPGTRQRVVLGPAAGGGLAPLRDNPALVLEPMERWIECAGAHLEHIARDLLDAKRDAPAMHRLERECLQDQQIERALQQLRRVCPCRMALREVTGSGALVARAPLNDRECSRLYSLNRQEKRHREETREPACRSS